MYAPHGSPARTRPAAPETAAPALRGPSRHRAPHNANWYRLGAVLVGLTALVPLTLSALGQLPWVGALALTATLSAALGSLLVGLRQHTTAPVTAPPHSVAPPAPVVAAAAGLPAWEQVQQAVADQFASRTGAAGALLLVGCDTPPGEDHCGVQAELSQRLRAVTVRFAAAEPGAALLCGRWRADGFAVLTEGSVLQAYALADLLVAEVARPVAVGTGVVHVRAYAGVTSLATAPSAADVPRRAELAVQRARQLGPGCVEWYDSSLSETMRRQEAIERELPGALRRGELDLIYQPIMDLVRDRPLGVEALLRWRHPEFGTLLPGDVIPAAEASGVMGELGHWVLHQACAQLASWRRDGRDLAMSVNISPRRLDSGQLVGEITRALDAHDLAPERLVIEFAEPRIEDGDALADHVGLLRSVGVRTALDEFGAGPASLEHLRRVPVDMVKLGRGLLAPHRTGQAGAPPSIDVMVGLGRRLGVEVVAQGLEAPAQLAAVRTAGCRLGQGHLFARPQPAERTEAYLDAFPAWPSVARR